VFSKNKKYKSEVSEFIFSLKSGNSQLEKKQKMGRAILWDRTNDTDLHLDENSNNVVKQPPYVYF
jgi:hypothetical protein